MTAMFEFWRLGNVHAQLHAPPPASPARCTPECTLYTYAHTHIRQVDKHIRRLDADLSRFEMELQLKDPSGRSASVASLTDLQTPPQPLS